MYGLVPEGFLGTQTDIMTASLKQCLKHAYTPAICDGKIWSFEYLKKLKSPSPAFKTYCVGHNYEVAQLWNEMNPDFKKRVNTKERLVTKEQSDSFFVDSDTRRIYPIVEVNMAESLTRSVSSKRRRGTHPPPGDDRDNSGGGDDLARRNLDFSDTKQSASAKKPARGSNKMAIKQSASAKKPGACKAPPGSSTKKRAATSK